MEQVHLLRFLDATRLVLTLQVSSLITPWNQKARSFVPNAPVLCPNENTRLYVD